MHECLRVSSDRSAAPSGACVGTATWSKRRGLSTFDGEVPMACHGDSSSLLNVSDVSGAFVRFFQVKGKRVMWFGGPPTCRIRYLSQPFPKIVAAFFVRRRTPTPIMPP